MDSSRSAQRAVIQFLRVAGEHASQIYRRMKEVFGHHCLARCTIFQWCQRYEAGCINIKDLPRPGQAHVLSNSATISAVDELIRQNRQINTREIAVELSISKATVHHIIHKQLGKASVRESEDGENGFLTDPSISTLKPSTPFLRAGISVSMSMAIIYSCTVPHELEYCYENFFIYNCSLLFIWAHLILSCFQNPKKVL
ncbi:hypothetical protein AVEN_181145-1 [Araneus ventricosus]|uniref:Mos1 transposase HTH domain-containing protein n=1 Tax=Araneus ventricosus TaxID=182803 RepID=A0A4Y2KQI0_ARAVE|nr:hypothetical protein AVEN_181145-1 [Araneus ventricosus]